MAISTILNTALGTLASSPLTEKVGSLLLAGRGRTIMGLFADVTIEEKHKDELVITDHPTEVGSPMSDHAYKEPPEVTIKVGWSESAGKLNGMVGDSILSETTGLVTIYETLQQLQDSKVLLVISTGKRLYTNMLIKSLGCTTDLQTENVLIIEMTLKKVFIVQSSETIVLLDNQVNPAATAGVSNGGTVQPKQVNESVLSKLATGIFGG
ncbi:hypothetical protein D3X56_05660 [Acinetobacter baumannii]|uniref:phage baseplate protein n=1 Tax=Acinetobacter baumannii TaxID=470 RepID=UPI000E69D0F1|nr:hypothetical protein [Acinetobacter baumannii]RIW98160.1 hypothetical protein D3X41_20260 [Acinetobacter baumannii]RIX17664.1 hypothetical protein D3X39_17265 [Acinetobacter baumannii]RJO01995.1 hypothetical protein D3X56_05660 [Acinetobacter baumannii]